MAATFMDFRRLECPAPGVRSSCTKSGDRIKDLVCGFVPDEGFWILVVVSNVDADGLFQLFGRAMHAAAELFFREQSEPALDQIEPAGRGGREMQMEARSFHQPVANQLGFMRAVPTRAA